MSHYHAVAELWYSSSVSQHEVSVSVSDIPATEDNYHMCVRAQEGEKKYYSWAVD